MKLTITEKKENPIFSRTELKFEIDHSGKCTPSRFDTIKLVAANSKASEELISINAVKSIFGQGKSLGLAHIYKKKGDLDKNEYSYILKRTQKATEKQTKSDSKEAEAAVQGQVPAETASAEPESSEEPTENAEAQPKQPAPEKPSESKEEATSEEPKTEEKPAEGGE